MLDTGSGYNSQNSKPVHVATGVNSTVDIEIKAMGETGPMRTRLFDVNVSGLNNETLLIRVE